MARRKHKSKYRRRIKRRVARGLASSKGRKHPKPRKHLGSHSRKRKGDASRRPKRARKRMRSDPRIEIALREMSRGRSLAPTARSLKLSPDDLQKALKQRRLLKRKGTRWVLKANLFRRVLVITGGGIRRVVVSTAKEARLAGKHYNAAGKFVETNDINVIKRYRGRSIRAANGQRLPLETDPNTLHRIAAIDSPAFHEIYEITSNT